ncbi:hypothetical protein L3Q72_15355 [Vibrio sp. JC009]|uniref:hypothetical protein n=1 Tax=Vibrio sp. JC009 TaxID=2912314 RepID=UPI0023B0C7FE|nr:hypothetical protein [Vibrio sp. JC009]WED24258.1 hypothetical protein L3Q72_15355 [Vibrio sp. JC009]
MPNETKEQILAYRIILLALDEMIRSGGKPRFEGDEASTNPHSFKELVMQYAGDKVSESAIDEALKIPLQDIAHILMERGSHEPTNRDT